jgi:hypothetical protein
MNITFQITKNQIALPVRLGWEFKKSYWMIAIQILFFGLQAIHVNVPKVTEELPELETARTKSIAAGHIGPTKAYADERQKAPRNRRRKPKKAMANLYNLG